MTVQPNVWEWTTEAQALDALAGPSTAEQIIEDRHQRAAELISLFTVSPDKAGFEIGSGTGLVAKLLAPHCARLDCNDISESFLREAARTCAGYDNVHFHRITDRYLDHLPGRTYDFGYSLNVFIHFNPYDIFNYLLDVARLLKPGGMFYFDACTVGEQNAGMFRQQAEMYRTDPTRIRGLLNFNSLEVISRLIDEAGLHTDRVTVGHGAWFKVLVTA